MSTPLLGFCPDKERVVIKLMRIRNLLPGTFGLTDMASVLEYVRSQDCQNGHKILILASDYIVTKNGDQMDAALNAIKTAGVKVNT